MRAPCRLTTGDTADWQSALQTLSLKQRPFQLKKINMEHYHEEGKI
jgi:hypothetical protein